MRSYFFRCAGYPLLWLSEVAYALAIAFSLPALALAMCGDRLHRGAMALWAHQDFRGANPRGWRWSGLFR